jgi:arylsulfatase A-like enzyme
VDETSVVAAVDFFPTLCTLCGVDLPAGAAFDGEDVSAVFRGQALTRARRLFWEYGRKPPAPDSKVLGGFPYPKEPGARSPNVAVRDGAWKLLVQDDGTGAELFNLEDDPRETRNRAAEHPELAGRLAKSALGWRRALP